MQDKSFRMKLINKDNIAILILIVIVLFNSCDKPEANPHEEFNSLNYLLTPQSGVSVILSASDTDGKGGEPPTITVDTFLRNTIYSGTMTFWDKSVEPEVEVTSIIQQSAIDYQVFYLPDSISPNITYIDNDAEGNPIGLNTILTTGQNNGLLRIVLRLRPDKSGPGVSAGNIANAGGVTELDINFPIYVK